MLKRNTKIDELRGLLMIFVVIGHIVQYVICPETFDSNIVFRFIYSFHMPLFMCLSGYVMQLGHTHMNRNLLFKRIISLLVPFLIWGRLSSFREAIPYYKLILYPGNGLWFLWVLAFITVFVYIAEKFERLIGPISYILMNFILFCVPTKIFGMDYVRVYFTWYVIGLVGPRYIKNSNWKKWIKCLGIIGWPLTVIFWMRREAPLFANMFTFEGISAKLFATFCTLYRIYLVPALGIVFVWTMFFKMSGGGVFNR